MLIKNFSFWCEILSHCVNTKFNEIPFTEINFLLLSNFAKFLPSKKNNIQVVPMVDVGESDCWILKYVSASHYQGFPKPSQLSVLNTTKTIKQRTKNLTQNGHKVSNEWAERIWEKKVYQAIKISGFIVYKSTWYLRGSVKPNLVSFCRCK